MEVTFDDIEKDFQDRVSRIVWCTVTTVDRKNRPRSRILHPVWEGATGWICTGRQTHKAKHLARNPYVSVTYWDAEHEQVHAECHAEWVDDLAQKERVWELFKSTPEPYGYDPVNFWEAPSDPNSGVLKLTPWRLELCGIKGVIAGGEWESRVWRQGDS